MADNDSLEPIPGTFTHKGNELEAKFEISIPNDKNGDFSVTKTSKKYLLNGLKLLQLKANIMKITVQTRENIIPYAYGVQNNCYSNCNKFTCQIFVRLITLRPCDNLIYAIRFGSAAFNKSFLKENIFFFDNDNEWRQVIEHQHTTESAFKYNFDMKFVMGLYQSPSQFKELYEDTELIDFELQAEDSSVHMHRFVLAASSPVLKAMFSGMWKETNEGRLKITGITKQTLENLKDYIYLRTVPDTGLQELLELGARYEMTELVEACSVKLLSKLTSQNAFEMIQFASEHKLTVLYFGILQSVQMGMITAHNIVNSVTPEWL